MLRSLRNSFAAKLVALEIGTIVVVSISLAALLISARLLQTRELEQNVSAKAVDALRRDFDTAGDNAASLSQRLAEFVPLAAEFQSPDRNRLISILAAEARVLPESETLVAFDGSGHTIVVAPGGPSGQAPPGTDPHRWDGFGLINRVAGGESLPHGSIEELSGSLELDGIAPVKRAGATVGYVLESINLQQFLRRVVPSGAGLQYSIYYGDRSVASTASDFASGQALPTDLSAGAGGALFGIHQRGGTTYATSYGTVVQSPKVQVAAEVDDAVFAAQRLNDVLVVLFATTLLATLLTVAAVYFANRFAVRPLAALTQGAEQLGAGDYSARVEVPSRDDFGRLAASFNSMAGQIRANTAELERQRARLDAAITSLSAVSGALTTTTTGARALRQAVLEAVTQITGAPAVAMYAGVRPPRATAAAGLTRTEAERLLAATDSAAVLASGESSLVSLAQAPSAYQGWSAVLVPMTYQGAAVGVLAGFSPTSLDDIDIPSLTVLANQATVALQNSELFQRERETVLRLQELGAMKSDFLATIQHELRTPLTAIMGMTDLMELAWVSWSDSQKLEAISDVQVAAKGLYDLVETILDYSMLESQKMRLTIGPCAVRDAAKAALDELQPLIRRHQVEVNLQVPAAIKAQADSQRLAQVMRALLDNAVKFSPRGSRIQVKASQQNGRVQVQVVDQGIGIDQENQARIFERFYQVDNTATRRYGGTGMGLALVQKLVDLQKGRVAVNSTPGRGSTFTVSLPSAN